MIEVESYVKDDYVKLWVSEGAYLALTNLDGGCTFFFFLQVWNNALGLHLIKMTHKKQLLQSKSRFISKLVLIFILVYKLVLIFIGVY